MDDPIWLPVKERCSGAAADGDVEAFDAGAPVNTEPDDTDGAAAADAAADAAAASDDDDGEGT